MVVMPVSSTNKRDLQAGMTLLEVLVVLVIIGVVIGVMSPSLVKVVESVSFKTKTDAIVRQIQDLRIAALMERRTLALSQNLKITQADTRDATSGLQFDEINQLTTEEKEQGRDDISPNNPVDNPDLTISPAISEAQSSAVSAYLSREVSLEEGWGISGDDVIFLKTGVCLGGDVTLSAPSGRKRILKFQAPDCRLVPLTDA